MATSSSRTRLFADRVHEDSNQASCVRVGSGVTAGIVAVACRVQEVTLCMENCHVYAFVFALLRALASNMSTFMCERFACFLCVLEQGTCLLRWLCACICAVCFVSARAHSRVHVVCCA